MKKVLMLMLGLVAGTASFANSTTTNPTTPSVSVSQTRLLMTTDHKLKFYVAPLQSKGDLSIQDAAGEAVYVSSVALQKGLNQQFDVSALGAGTYQLTLKTGDQIVTKTFVIQADPNTSFVVQES